MLSLTERGSGYSLRNDNDRYLGGFCVYHNDGVAALTTGTSCCRFVEVDYNLEDAMLKGYALLKTPAPDFSDLDYQVATYTGVARMQLYAAEGGDLDVIDSRERYRADTTLNVNFSDLTISGRLDNWVNSDSQEDDLGDIVLTLPETRINAETTEFEATFQASGLDAGVSADLNYYGAFSGLESDSGLKATAGGVFSGTISDSEGSSTAIGFFWGGTE